MAVDGQDDDPFTATLIDGRPDLTQFTLTGRRPASWLAEVGTVTADAAQVQALGADGKPLIARTMTPSPPR